MCHMMLKLKLLMLQQRGLLHKRRVGALKFSVLIIPFILITSSVLNISCSSGSYPYKIYALAGETMGTTYHIKIILPSEKSLPEGLATNIHSILTTIDKMMTTYKDDSELMQFNNYQGDLPFPVSEEMREVFEIAMDVSEQTNGAFDITVYPLVELWGFAGKEVSGPPPDGEIKKTLQHIGYRKIKITNDGIIKEDKGTKCDLSAVAKGYAVDKVCDLLNGQGINSYMVEVGGEVKTKGEKLPGVLWTVGIEYPEPITRKVFRSVKVKDIAMATSGNYRNYFVWDGKKFSHEIDPSTGYPVLHTLTSVSVLHDSCAYADAYATAFMVMGLEKAYQFAEEHNIPAFFIYPTSELSYSYKYTSAWKRLVR